MNHEPWVQKYAPKHLDEVIGNADRISKFKRLALHSQNTKKGIFLEGPHGIGKTAAVYAFAEQHDYEVVEINASDTRKKKDVQRLLSSVIGQQSLFAQGKIVLVDEVEGLSGRSDRGGASAVAKIIDQSPFPVVVTGIDAEERKLKKLKKKTIRLTLKKLSTQQVHRRLQHICAEEGIQYNDRDLKQLARSAGGDLRAAINDLQTNVIGAELIYNSDVVASRDLTTAMRDALTRIFKTKNADVASGAFDNVDQNLDDIFLWVNKNLYKEYEKPLDLAAAYEELSLADVFYGRIRRRQYYRFYAYCYTLLSTGIALAKQDAYPKTTKFEEPDLPLTIWIYNRKTKKPEAVAEALAEYTHISKNEARRNVLPFLKAHAENNKGWGEWLGEELELEKKEKKWLLS